MHRGLKATTCLIFHGHCASWLYFLLSYHFPSRPKSPILPSRLRGKPLCDLVSQQTWPIISACHWEPFRGINRAAAAKRGGRGASSTSSGTVQKVTSRSFAARALAHCERLRYSLLPVRPRPFHAKARKEERWERGIVFLSPSHSLSLPLPSSLFQMQSVSST